MKLNEQELKVLDQTLEAIKKNHINEKGFVVFGPDRAAIIPAVAYGLMAVYYAYKLYKEVTSSKVRPLTLKDVSTVRKNMINEKVKFDDLVKAKEMMIKEMR